MEDKVDDDERIIRLLFSHTMTDDDGILTPQVFPMEELIQQKGKSTSVDREALLPSLDVIPKKLEKFENPNAGRAKWGFSRGCAKEIRNIVSQCDQQVFDIYSDPIKSAEPEPWDDAHGKIVQANPNFQKSFVRGYRDKLIEIFQMQVHKIF